jgi:mRNA-degrading endonuclease RelE of RelBE toxin-antitoxin system
MAYRIEITDSANKNLNDILHYMIYDLGTIQVARRFIGEVEENYKKVADNPFMYEVSRDAYLKSKGYHRIVIGNYVILYLIDNPNKVVNICGFFYCRQDYSKLL